MRGGGLRILGPSPSTITKCDSEWNAIYKSAASELTTTTCILAKRRIDIFRNRRLNQITDGILMASVC
jgi:hypothetical protein